MIYSLQKGASQPPVTKVFSQSGESRHPKLSTSYPNQDTAGRSKLLSSHLERLLVGAPRTQEGTPDGDASRPSGKLRYLSYVRPAPGKNAKLLSQVPFGSKTQTPDLDRLMFKAGSNQVTSKEPLSVMDGKISFDSLV